MSTDQPRPGPGEEPSGTPPGPPPGGGPPSGGAPPPPSPPPGPPPGGAPPPPPGRGEGPGPPEGHGEQGPGGRGEPGGGWPGGGWPGAEPGAGPYAASPYGDRSGAADPLAGMPPLANRGRRLVARVIDGLVVGIPVGLLLWLVMGGYVLVGDGGRSTTSTVVTVLVYFVYEALMLTSRGQTLGKMAMRIRVAMLADGAIPAGQAGWSRAAVYSLPQVVPCVGFFFWLVNVLFCTWDRPYRQCLHDKAARTVVVEARQGPRPGPAAPG